ncbi:MAG: transposase [Acidobacteria bacterium]|nr:transposase [Acidobacteriota bacterium]
MLNILIPLFSALRAAFRSCLALQTEILALRQQIIVLKRSTHRPKLQFWDRFLWIWLLRLWPQWRSARVIVKPETVIAWHRKGFRLFWTWKCQHGKSGRPGIPKDVRELIRTMSKNNATWGAPRIHGELLKLGISISQATVAKYMHRHPKPPSQTWRAFLQKHAKQLASIDFFTVPTISFRVLYVFLVLSHERRRVIHFNVTSHPTAEWTSQQLLHAFPYDSAPQYIIRDRDCIYGEVVQRQLEELAIQQVLTAPRSPRQTPYVERLIGSIRRECLDHILTINEASLRANLRSYFSYYHDSRCHLGLDKDSPKPREIQPPHIGRIVEIPKVGGLHHRYERRAA